MPELPEVETIRKILQEALVGKRILGIQVLLAKQFQGKKEDIVGTKIIGVERRGKFLKISLANKKSLLIHLKLTGQLIWVPQTEEEIVTLDYSIPFGGNKLPAKTTHIIFEIEGGRLFFNDLRQFGWIKVVENDKLQEDNSEIEKLGPEPFDKEFTVDYLKQVFSKTAKPIKLVLMDQEKIAGIGNIYANEALFEAGILPSRPTKELTTEEIGKLKEGIIKVLKEGLKYGGSSAADEAYIKPTGEPGEYQRHFRVYQRHKQPCPRCGSQIQRVQLGGRGTFFCPRCQK